MTHSDQEDTMRTLIWSVCIVVLFPSATTAQGSDEPSLAAVSVEPWNPTAISDPASPNAVRSLQPGVTPGAASCGLNSVAKGAIIGAGVGAGFGIGWGLLLCDGSHCYISGYVKAAALFGGIGAAIGAAIGGVDDAHRRAHPSIRHVAVDVAPVVTRDTRGAVVSLRFGQ
jgi:hypothetical protein